MSPQRVHVAAELTHRDAHAPQRRRRAELMDILLNQCITLLTNPLTNKRDVKLLKLSTHTNRYRLYVKFLIYAVFISKAPCVFRLFSFRFIEDANLNTLPTKGLDSSSSYIYNNEGQKILTCTLMALLARR